MDKNRKNKSYNVYNKDIIKRLVEKYEMTPHFIYASLRGDRVSQTSIQICEDYKKMKKRVNEVLQNL